MDKHRLWPLALLIPLLLLPDPARGAEKPLWEVGTGLALMQMPDYRGSDESRLYLLPLYVPHPHDVMVHMTNL